MSWIVQLMAASQGKTEGQVYSVLQVGCLQQSQTGAEELEQFLESLGLQAMLEVQWSWVLISVKKDHNGGISTLQEVVEGKEQRAKLSPWVSLHLAYCRKVISALG